MRLCAIIVYLATFVSFAQTESISIVQYTAGFAEQVTLDNYKDYNVETLFMSKAKSKFDKNNIKLRNLLIKLLKD